MQIYIYIVIVSACVCEHACMDVSILGGGGGGGETKGRFMYINVVCFDVCCF